MRSAQSYPLDPAAIRPEKHRLRHQRPVRKRIRSSVSAGPTMTTFQRCNRTHQICTILDEKPQICRPCSASADVSSISSSTTDSVEQRAGGEDLTRATLQRIMHTKHGVIRCARKQMIKLVNNDLVPQDDLTGSRLLQTNQNTNKLNRSPMDYDLDRQRSICGKICHEDDIIERLDEHPGLTVRDKYGFDGRVSLNTDRRPSETHADDGRILGAKNDSKNHFCEYSPKIHGERSSPDGIHYSLINGRVTKKMTKYYVPFTNNNEMDEEIISKNTLVGKAKYIETTVSSKMEENAVEKDTTKSEQLKRFNTRTEESLPSRHGLQQAMPLAKPSDSANIQPSVKTFYENPYLKDPSGSSMRPIVTESKSHNEFTSRSTNTSPVPQKAQSTNTIVVEDLISQNMAVAVGKDAAKRRPSFHRPFYAIQPLLFVLAMFTVSMSGAYVGVLVASTGCGSCSGVECEPSILQWLFSSRRHIRAF